MKNKVISINPPSDVRHCCTSSFYEKKQRYLGSFGVDLGEDVEILLMRVLSDADSGFHMVEVLLGLDRVGVESRNVECSCSSAC